MCKKYLCFILSVLMLMSVTIPASAAEDNIEMQPIPVPSAALSDTLEDSLSGEFDNAIPASANYWIQLYDVAEIPYAYFVPLYNNAEKLIGYSVISDLDGNNTVLVSSEGEGAAVYARIILETYARSVTGTKLIYVFPDAFLVGKDAQYRKINVTGVLSQVDDINTYQSNTVGLLRESSSQASAYTSRAITTVYGSLDDWDTYDFVPVTTSGGGVYYGGYQGWLTDEGVSEFWANRACGLTAAANAMYYMSQNVNGKANLYTKSDISKSSFSAYQKELYDYCFSPAIWGIPTWASMKSKVEEWADYKNVSLTGVEDTSTWNATNVRTYIADGLNSERPVLLLTWNSPVEDLNWHWVTVTRIYLDGTVKILTSNWAGKTEYDFATWVNGNGAYKGVLYFN